MELIVMKAILTLAAVLAVAATASPALAKSKKKVIVHPGHYYGQTYAPGFWNGIPAPVIGGYWGNDPSIGHPSAASLSANTGRCVEDLGYGRFKYCGW
jgi:hypothetical protein